VLGSSVVDGAIADVATANISDRLKLVLVMLRKLTRDHTQIQAADMRQLLDAGITRPQIEDALDVAWAFNIITRLADAFEFALPTQAGLDASAKMLLSRGYKL